MTHQKILVDTGPLVAIFSRRDRYHTTCVEQLRQLTEPLITCWPVVTEAAWLLKENPLAVSKLFGSFQTGFLRLASIEESSFEWISDFMQQYRDIGPQLADACLMYLADTKNIETIFTLDRRDFLIYRLSEGRTLHLIPEL